MFFHLIRLARPYQWVKNLFLFLPVFFGGKILDLASLRNAAAGFICFSLVSSSIYCLNDIIDKEVDKKHPTKSKRPVAAGNISVPGAALFMLGLILAALLLLYMAHVHSFYETVFIIVCYLSINIAYSLKLKKIAILDVMIIAVGFVLRIFAGGSSTGIVLSKWIVMMVFLLTLVLALGKRKDDVLLFSRTGVKPRENTDCYSAPFVDMSIVFISSVTMVCYIMYTVSSEVMERMGTSSVYLTSVFVLAGMIRYLQIAVIDNLTGDPTKLLLRDGFIQICLLCWIASFRGMIYV